MPRATEATRDDRGFTLLEILVALIIFAIAFGVLGQIVRNGFRQSASADATTTATLVARSQLERVGADLPVEPGRYHGETDDGFHWQTEIVPADLALEEQDLAGYVVRVTVAWGPPGGERAIELATLRLGGMP